MALKIGDRVRENTSSTGVGGLSLTGAPAGFQRFSAILASGDTTYYSLEENDKFEVGIGTYGSNNLERTTVLSSSNSGSKISLGGSGVVFITYPAAKAFFASESDEFTVPSSGLVFSNGTVIKDAKLVELSDVNLSGTPVQNSVFDLNITNKSLSIGDLTGPTNSNNILIGYGAGSGITTGSDSVIIGAESSTINKTGQHNVHIGSKAGPVVSDAASSVYNSVAVGYSAGNKMRHESVAIGYEAALHAYEIGFIGIGYQVGSGLGSYSTVIGYQAGRTLAEDYAVALGYQAGYNGAGEASVWIGQGAGHSSTGSNKSIGIGKNSGKSSSGAECIYIGEGAGTSNSSNNLVFIGNSTPATNGSLVKGDMDAKRIAIGVADVTLDDTLFVGVNSANDEGIVVKGAASQASNLTSWKNSADGVLASVNKDGVVSAHEIIATGNGIQIASLVPISTTNKLYNNSGELYFNGSAIGGGDVSTAQLNYVSGIAVYSSGQVVANQSNITALLTASGTATSLISSSGIATYASGQAVSNQSAISTNTSRVVYASGQAISNQSEIIAVSGWSDSTFLKIDDDTYVSGIAAYGSGQAISNQSSISTNSSNISTNTSNISTNSGRATYASGLAISNELNVAYASGQAITNEGDIFAVSGIAAYASGNLGTGDVTAAQLNYVSGIAVYASGHVHDDLYVSGVASYASGQAISNQSNITTNTSNISTNTGNISSNTAKVNYASGQAIENESDIAALLTASGTATSLIASSGIANYASGQAVSNQANITTNTNNITYVSGIAAYASGQVNVTTDGTAEASKALVLDSAKSFTGVKDGRFSQFDSFVYSTGVSVGNSGVSMARNTPSVITDTLYNVGGTLYFNGSQLASAGGASATAQYASGQATSLNTASGIATSLLSVSGTATSLISTSGIATYASGRAIANESDIVAASGISAYASGLAITNEARVNYASGLAITNEARVNYASGQAIENEGDLVAVSGIAAYASGVSLTVKEADNSPNVSNVRTIVVSNGTLTDNGGGQVTLTTGGGGGGGDVTTTQLNYVSGIAVYASGQSQSLNTVSGVATSLVASSGIATYASGQAVANQSSATTNASNISTNTGNISTNTARVSYASGQAISNQGNITALLSASGTATSLIASSGIATYASGQAIANEGDIVATSGIANYASGQAISNQSNITALNTASGIATSLLTVSGTATSLVATSGIATYASGQVNITTDGTVEASKAIILDSAKSFTGIKHGRFSQFDSFVYSTGVSVGNSGVILVRNTPGVTTDTLYNVGGTLYFNGSQLASAGGASTTAQYASGQAISNQSNITALNTASGIATSLITVSGTATSLVASSGIATYASGQAIENEGLATYASGQAISNQGNITALSTASGIATSLLTVSGTATSLVASSGIATYASGNTANISFGSNAEGDILYHNGTSFIRLAKGTDDYILKMNGNVPNWEAESGGGGDVTTAQLNYVSGIAVYSSGQSILNQSNITALNTASGIATSLLAVSGTATSLVSSSGIATYASGQAIENEGLATYASGQAISNQSNITALNTASGIATSLLTVSGVATSLIATSGTTTALIASSGIATYASGQVNVSSAGTAVASKALVLDSAKSFTGTKHGVFNEFDSRVTASGVTIGASGITLTGGAFVQEAVPANDTPTAEDATVTLDLSTGNFHNISLGQNVTKFEFTNAKRGQRFILRITQNASSAKTISWSNVDYTTGGAAATVRWAGNITPTMSTSTSHTDVYGFLCTNNAGSEFDGFIVGQDLHD
jgi:hypothetical protein